jgi:hypothetical protein
MGNPQMSRPLILIQIVNDRIKEGGIMCNFIRGFSVIVLLGGTITVVHAMESQNKNRYADNNRKQKLQLEERLSEAYAHTSKKHISEHPVKWVERVLLDHFLDVLQTADRQRMDALLDEGLDVSELGGALLWHTPAHIEYTDEQKDIIKLIFDRGALLPQARRANNWIVSLYDRLQWSIDYDLPQWLMNYLFEKYPQEKNKQDEEGYTAVMYAAQRSDFFMLEKLLKVGCSTKIRNNEGKTAGDLVKVQLTVESMPGEKNFEEQLEYDLALLTAQLLDIAEGLQDKRINSMYGLCLLNKRSNTGQTLLPILPTEILQHIRSCLKEKDVLDMEEQFEKKRKESLG